MNNSIIRLNGCKCAPRGYCRVIEVVAAIAVCLEIADTVGPVAALAAELDATAATGGITLGHGRSLKR